jgi:hypothetical protein
MNKLARFEANQRVFIEFCCIDGLSCGDILTRFTKKFYPDTEYCKTDKERQLFSMRVTKYKAKVEKSKMYKEILLQGKRAFAKKDHRVLTRNNQISSIMSKLNEFRGLSVLEMSREEVANFKELNALLLNALDSMAKEMGQFKTSAAVNVNFDQRQLNVFPGQATVPRLEGDDKTGLRIVAPSVKALDSGGEIMQPALRPGSEDEKRVESGLVEKSN